MIEANVASGVVTAPSAEVIRDSLGHTRIIFQVFSGFGL